MSMETGLICGLCTLTNGISCIYPLSLHPSSVYSEYRGGGLGGVAVRVLSSNL